MPLTHEQRALAVERVQHLVGVYRQKYYLKSDQEAMDLIASELDEHAKRMMFVPEHPFTLVVWPHGVCVDCGWTKPFGNHT